MASARVSRAIRSLTAESVTNCSPETISPHAADPLSGGELLHEGDEPLVGGKAGAVGEIFLQQAFLEVVVKDGARRNEVEDAQPVRERAGDAAVDHIVRAEAGDEHLRADGGVDLADAAGGGDDPFARALGRKEFTAARGLDFPVGEGLADEVEFAVHRADDADRNHKNQVLQTVQMLPFYPKGRGNATAV